MHRFRKKSDAKRSQVPESLRASQLSNQNFDTSADSLPLLPPVSDFRTSLILPSLSRRFTLLRESNAISFDDVRSKIAEQRARGDENHILAEEEDTIVKALTAIANNPNPERLSLSGLTPHNTATVSIPTPDSVFAMQQDAPSQISAGKSVDYSTSVGSGIAPSIASTPSSVYPPSTLSTAGTSRISTSFRSSKRNSNNLFGFNQTQDKKYIQNVSKGSVSSRSTASLIGTDSHSGSVGSIHSLRETENNNTEHQTSHDLEPKADGALSLDKTQGKLAEVTPPKISQEFTPQQFGRATLALETLLRGMEEEVEETIMVPRTSASRTGVLNSRTQSPKPSETPITTVGTPIPWMTEEARVDDRDVEDQDNVPSVVANVAIASPSTHVPIRALTSLSSSGPHSRPGTTSPTPRLPGYIPGMPRPLTPHDAESDRDDTMTGYSTTPRARSPAHSSYGNNSTSLSFSSSRQHIHSNSISSVERQSQSILPPSILRSSRGTAEVPPLRTKSPALGNRSRNDNVNSTQVPNPLPSPGPEDRFPSDLFIRRPLSPLSSAVATAGYSISRPSTPAASLWRSNSPLSQMHPPMSLPNSSRPELGRHSRNGSLASTDFHVDSSQRSPGIWMPATSHEGSKEPHTMSQHVSVSSMELGTPLNSSRSASIATRVPTPVSARAKSPNSDSPSSNGQDPILLNRILSKRTPKRMQSPTSLPHQIVAPVALHTPSSSISPSNIHNLNVFLGPGPMISPLMNNSATSLLSTGSSYHSGPDDHRKKSGWDELVEYDTQRSAWEIINSQDNHGSETDNASDTESVENPEEILRRTVGLSKSDIMAVQNRLIEDGKARQASETPRSPTRRRRMSNSRASFSAQGRESGANSPALPPRQPTPVAVVNASTSPEPESTARANALLDSVLLSIEAQTNGSNTVSATSSDFPSIEPQSTTDDDHSGGPSTDSSQRQSREDDSSSRMKALVEAIAGHETPVPEEPTDTLEMPSVSPIEPVHSDSGEATEVPPARLWRGPAVVIPPTIPKQLEDVISRKAAEATAALKNPSQATNGDSDHTIRRKPPKRIDLQHISNPQFVSSSTSVNAIPIIHSQKHSRVTSTTTTTTTTTTGSPLDRSASTKLSERFKKLRGTLRSKPATRDGSEVQPFTASTPTQLSPMSSRRKGQSPTSPQGQVLTYPHTQQHHTIPASATEQARFKVNVPSPPASASPSLLGFMSIFRKPKKNSGKESIGSGNHSAQRSPDTASLPPSGNTSQRGYVMSPPGTAQPRPSYEHAPSPLRSPTPVRPSEDYGLVNDRRAMSPTRDPATVDEFRRFANVLGIPENELNDLLARSETKSSQNATAGGIPPSAPTSDASPIPARNNVSGDRSKTPDLSRSASMDRSKTPEAAFNRSKTPDLSHRPFARTAAGASRYPEGEVVRRTLIFASDNPSTSDLNGFHRKELSGPSGRQSRSASVASLHSTGSASRPPVPRLVQSQSHSSKPSESSSFYDIYSNPDPSSSAPAQNGLSENSSIPTGAAVASDEPGHGPAIEVVQLSNGDVIWSVLDSLRQEDDEDSPSLFRHSMSSRDEVEVRVKGHGRYDSKGSNVSQASHTIRRRLPGVNAPRPETKVFKTNASTIGRLIDDLSKNMDSGTINFRRPTGAAVTQSNPVSFHSETSSREVERELEALLSAINSPRQGS